MLDVHPPHHRLEGLKDFFIHLLTISVGLLIAVGIEGCVERHQHRELARDARETLRKEIEGNSKRITVALTKIEKEQTEVTAGIKFLEHLRQNPNDKNAQNGSISADFSYTPLDDTAWKTAQTTGALAFMPYEEANKYSGVYEAQYQFQVSEEKITEDAAQFGGVIHKYGFDPSITPEAVTAALERLGIMQMHLATHKVMAELAAETDKSFLTGKNTAYSFQEDIKN